MTMITTMRTAYCIECAARMKHIKATSYSGYLVFFDSLLDERQIVLAGWCQHHGKKWFNKHKDEWPHKKSVGDNKKYCFGIWHADQGLIT